MFVGHYVYACRACYGVCPRVIIKVISFFITLQKGNSGGAATFVFIKSLLMTEKFIQNLVEALHQPVGGTFWLLPKTFVCVVFFGSQIYLVHK
jgi:hypothetical protein